jgi:transposase
VNTRDTATKLLILAALKKRIEAAEKRLKDNARDDFDRPGVRDIGLIGDTQIGHVRVDAGSRFASVTSPDRLLAWAKTNHPESIETVERVSDAHLSRWLDSCKRNGGVLDESTGDCPMPDGVTVREGSSKLVVVASSDSVATLSRALADGSFNLRDALALEAGESA